MSATVVDQVKMQLLLAFDQPGCPLCRLRRDVEHSYVLSLLGERFSDDASRRRLRSSLGLCHTHAWTLQALERQVNRTGMATGMLYEELTEWVLQVLRAYLAQVPAAGASVAPGGALLPIRLWRRLKCWVTQRENTRRRALPFMQVLLSQLKPQSGCPACEAGVSGERDAIENLVCGLSDAAFRAAYGASDGLCLVHLRSALTAVHSEADACFLVESTLCKLKILTHDLNEFLRKHSWQYHHEPKLAWEQASWIRAIAFMVGEAPSDVAEHTQRVRLQAQLDYRERVTCLESGS